MISCDIMKLANFVTWLREKLFEFKRVIMISRKPSWDEVWRTTKITAAGTIIVGTLGFIIQMIFYYLGAR